MSNNLRVSERHTSRLGGRNCLRPEETRHHCFLGVKWSQVQILSARQECQRVKAVSEKSGTAFSHTGNHGGQARPRRVRHAGVRGAEIRLESRVGASREFAETIAARA